MLTRCDAIALSGVKLGAVWCDVTPSGVERVEGVYQVWLCKYPHNIFFSTLISVPAVGEENDCYSNTWTFIDRPNCREWLLFDQPLYAKQIWTAISVTL